MSHEPLTKAAKAPVLRLDFAHKGFHFTLQREESEDGLWSDAGDEIDLVFHEGTNQNFGEVIAKFRPSLNKAGCIDRSFRIETQKGLFGYIDESKPNSDTWTLLLCPNMQKVALPSNEAIALISAAIMVIDNTIELN